MVRRKTFWERDFFTTSLLAVWILEISYKSLSINDLHTQGGPPRKSLTINDLQKLDLGAKSEQNEKIRNFFEKIYWRNIKIWYILTMTNEINYLASINCTEVFADAEAFFDYINSADVINEMLDKMAPSYNETETIVEVK